MESTIQSALSQAFETKNCCDMQNLCKTAPFSEILEFALSDYDKLLFVAKHLNDDK